MSNTRKPKDDFDAVRLPVMPLRDMAIGPTAIATIFMSRDLSIRAAEASLREHSGRVVLATQTDKDTDEPGAQDFWAYGTVGEIEQLLRLPDGTVKALVRGMTRVFIRNLEKAEGGYLTAPSLPIPDALYDPQEAQGYKRTLLKVMQGSVKDNAYQEAEAIVVEVERSLLAGLDDSKEVSDKLRKYGEYLDSMG